MENFIFCAVRYQLSAQSWSNFFHESPGWFKSPLKTGHIAEQKKKDFCDQHQKKFWKEFCDFYEKFTRLALAVFIFLFFNERPGATRHPVLPRPGPKSFYFKQTPRAFNRSFTVFLSLKFVIINIFSYLFFVFIQHLAFCFYGQRLAQSFMFKFMEEQKIVKLWFLYFMSIYNLCFMAVFNFIRFFDLVFNFFPGLTNGLHCTEKEVFH